MNDVRPPILDKFQALQRMEGDEEMYSEIVELFLEDSPVQLGNLRQAVADGDKARTERLAHSLKSAAANIGAEAFREKCLALEVLARNSGPDEGWDTMRENLSILDQEYQRLIICLREVPG